MDENLEIILSCYFKRVYENCVRIVYEKYSGSNWHRNYQASISLFIGDFKAATDIGIIKQWTKMEHDKLLP